MSREEPDLYAHLGMSVDLPVGSVVCLEGCNGKGRYVVTSVSQDGCEASLRKLTWWEAFCRLPTDIRLRLVRLLPRFIRLRIPLRWRV